MVERQQQQQLACMAVLAWGQRRLETQNHMVKRSQAQMQQAQSQAQRAEHQLAALNAQVPLLQYVHNRLCTASDNPGWM